MSTSNTAEHTALAALLDLSTHHRAPLTHASHHRPTLVHLSRFRFSPILTHSRFRRFSKCDSAVPGVSLVCISLLMQSKQNGPQLPHQPPPIASRWRHLQNRIRGSQTQLTGRCPSIVAVHGHAFVVHRADGSINVCLNQFCSRVLSKELRTASNGVGS